MSYAIHHWRPVSFAVALIGTLKRMVEINAATAQRSAGDPPPDWKEKRDRWEFFQAVRSWLLLIGFLLCLAMTL